MIDLLTSEDCRVVRATSDLFNNLEWWGDLTWPTKRQRQRHTYKDTQDMMFELAEVNLGAKVWKKQRRLSAERLSTHQKRWNRPKFVLKCWVFITLFERESPKATSAGYTRLLGTNMRPNMHIWAGIQTRQVCSSGVSLKRSCKMQFRCIGFRSIGPSSQIQVQTKSNFCPIFPF